MSIHSCTAQNKLRPQFSTDHRDVCKGLGPRNPVLSSWWGLLEWAGHMGTFQPPDQPHLSEPSAPPKQSAKHKSRYFHSTTQQGGSFRTQTHRPVMAKQHLSPVNASWSFDQDSFRNPVHKCLVSWPLLRLTYCALCLLKTKYFLFTLTWLFSVSLKSVFSEQIPPRLITQNGRDVPRQAAPAPSDRLPFRPSASISSPGWPSLPPPGLALAFPLPSPAIPQPSPS